MQCLDGFFQVFTADKKLHIDTAAGLLRGKRLHAGSVERFQPFQHDAEPGEIAPDHRHHACATRRDARGGIAFCQIAFHAAHGFERRLQMVDDGIRVRAFRDDAHAVAGQRFQDRSVISLYAHHVLLEEFERGDRQAGDHFHACPIGRLGIDERAGIFRLESIGNTQRHTRLTQFLCRLRVDRLHAHIGELVGDIVIGAADLAHILRSHKARIGARKVEFLVNDRFARAGQCRDGGEGHFGIAAVEFAHQPFAALRVAGDDGQLA